MGSKKKVEIASEEDVRKYAASAPSDGGAGEAAESGKEGESAVEAAGQEAPVDETAALRKQVEELQEKFLRARADFENLQRRSQQERIEAIRYANADLGKSLLTVLDNFERALQAATAENASLTSMVEGVRLVYESLRKVLADNQITEIATDAQKFDPRLHQAVMQQPSADHPHLTILQTVEKGYKHHDRVLRPAKVIVSKSIEPASADEAKAGTPEN